MWFLAHFWGRVFNSSVSSVATCWLISAFFNYINMNASDWLFVLCVAQFEVNSATCYEYDDMTSIRLPWSLSFVFITQNCVLRLRNWLLKSYVMIMTQVELGGSGISSCKKIQRERYYFSIIDHRHPSNFYWFSLMGSRWPSLCNKQN